MRVRLADGVERDLTDAVLKYEKARDGLGDEFSIVVGEAISEIADNPQRWPAEVGDVRRFLLHRFPYKIIYQLREEVLWIYAVMHTSRRPGYWRKRVTKK